MKIRKRDFFTQRRTIKRLTILVGIFLALGAQLGVFYFINGSVINFSDAYNTVKFSQKITAFNPIEKIGEIKKTKFSGNDYTTSKYRVVKTLLPTEEKDVETVVPSARVVNSVVEFVGKAAYPNSQILLEIHSEPFFTNVQSDGSGNWTWSNFGYPFEIGSHTIEMYNLSPYEISGKRDVFADKYSFEVVAQNDNRTIQKMELQSEGYEETAGDEDAGDSLLENNAHGYYLFSAILLNKKEYIPGDSINLQMNFADLGVGEPEKADLVYEILPWSSESSGASVVMTSTDSIILDGDNSFLKDILLKDRLVEGDYVLRILANVSGKKYLQNMKFSVLDKEIVKIGSVIVTREKLSNTLVWNTLTLLALTIIMLVVIIFEYKRFICYSPIDEHLLSKKGYFS